MRFKVRKKDKGFDKVITHVVRIFKRPAEIVNTTDAPLEHKAIFVANHCGAKGPFNITTAFRKIDHDIMTWSAAETGGSLSERWKYFYHVFYHQKLHYSKPRSFISATLFAPIYPMVFRYAGLIPVYKGVRIKKTYNYTVRCLDEDVSVIIFPEDSSEGYREIPEEFYRGFVVAAKVYLGKTGIDVPIYPLYYAPHLKKAFVGEPLYYGQLSEEMSDNEMCVLFLEHIRELAAKYGGRSGAQPVGARGGELAAENV